MGKKRIIAYFMHEAELAEASKHMSNVEATDSFLLGDIEESDIGQIQAKGVIWQEVPSPASQETPTAEMARSAEFRSTRAAARAIPPLPPAAVVDPNGPNFYLLRVDGPLVPGYRRRLEAINVKPEERVAVGTYIVKLEPRTDSTSESAAICSQPHVVRRD